MHKMVALFPPPEDVQAFEKHYREVHLPLARKMPGLKRLVVTRFTGAPMGEPDFYLMAEMVFASEGELQAAARSPEGLACGKDAWQLSGGKVRILFARAEEG